MNGIITFIKRVIDKVVDDETNLLPTSLAFYSILSLVPILTLISLTLGSTNIMNYLLSQLPEDIATIIYGLIIDVKSNSIVFLSTTAFVSLYVGSQGIYAMIRVINKMYSFPQRNIFLNHFKAVLGMIVLVFASFLLIVFVGLLPILQQFVQNTPMKGYLGIPAFISVVFILLTFVFMISPNKYIKLKYVVPGSAFASIVIMVAVYVFNQYAGDYSKYQTIYGSISNLIVIILLVYILSYIIYIAICINVVIYEIHHPQEQSTVNKHVLESRIKQILTHKEIVDEKDT